MSSLGVFNEQGKVIAFCLGISLEKSDPIRQWFCISCGFVGKAGNDLVVMAALIVERFIRWRIMRDSESSVFENRTIREVFLVKPVKIRSAISQGMISVSLLDIVFSKSLSNMFQRVIPKI